MGHNGVLSRKLLLRNEASLRLFIWWCLFGRWLYCSRIDEFLFPIFSQDEERPTWEGAPLGEPIHAHNWWHMKWSHQPLRISLKSIVRETIAVCPWNFVLPVDASYLQSKNTSYDSFFLWTSRDAPWTRPSLISRASANSSAHRTRDVWAKHAPGFICFTVYLLLKWPLWSYKVQGMGTAFDFNILYLY